MLDSRWADKTIPTYITSALWPLGLDQVIWLKYQFQPLWFYGALLLNVFLKVPLICLIFQLSLCFLTCLKSWLFYYFAKSFKCKRATEMLNFPKPTPVSGTASNEPRIWTKTSKPSHQSLSGLNLICTFSQVNLNWFRKAGAKWQQGGSRETRL